MSFPQIGVDVIPVDWGKPTIDIGDDGFLVELAAKAQMIKNLDEECDRQEEFWAHRISALAPLIPRTKLPVPSIIRVSQSNIYTGARPSLLQAPIDFWPSVTVRCGDLRPDRDQADHFDTLLCDFYVEVMCAVGTVDKEHLHLQDGIDLEGNVNMQVHLLSGAVQMAIARDKSLGGMIPPIQRPPSIHPSFPTAVAGVNNENVGDYYLYQGRQHHYVITRNTF